MADEVVCSPYKSIPQSMIDNVLLVCPDVDRKDVAKDLVITGSATRTINRILDGQVSEHACPVATVRGWRGPESRSNRC